MREQPLAHLLQAVTVRAAVEAGDVVVRGVTIDSRKVEPGWLFVACRGVSETSADGHRFVDRAVKSGAVAVVVEDRDAASGVDGAGVYVVADSRVAAARLVESFYDHPSRALDVVGVTGTNGKTTVSLLVADVLSAAGRDAAVLGTLGVGRRDALRPMGFTTPEAELLSRELRALLDDGVNALAMEVSSHALATERVAALEVAVAAFTNLSRDHLDLHKTMEQYFAAKVRLFTERRRAGAAAVLPTGGGEWEARLRAAVDGDVIGYGREEEARVRLLDATLGASGMTLRLAIDDVEGEVESPLLGAPNVQNLLCAAGCALGLGLAPAAVLAALPAARPVPGRFERVPGSGGGLPAVVVDYAHTPDALERALASCRALASGRVVVVFGCGGDRDPGKRPLMGAAAAAGADVAVVTDDNPRSEEPARITDAVVEGMAAMRDAGEGELADGSFTVVHDRREAIARALAAAGADDVVLVAGKGHEDTQTAGGDVRPFSDVRVAAEILKGATL